MKYNKHLGIYQYMKKQVPITRIGKFFGQEDFDLDINMGEEWLHGDMNFSLVLYRVDRQKTKTDDVYGEAVQDGIQFLSPVEFKGYVKIAAPDNKYVADSLITTNFAGNIEIGVYQKHLDELQIEVSQGDYIGYYETENKVRYYSVWDDGRITSDLRHSYGGYKAFYRTIKAVSITDSEFRGL